MEATCWVLLALSDDEAQSRARGLDWLRRAQLPDGSWPTFVGHPEGSWNTALACLSLRDDKESSELVDRGINWLLNAWPAEGGWWWRLRHRLFRSSVVHQDSSLRGWSWTPGTASWVEPTSYALILLHSFAQGKLPAAATQRILLAEKMLYNRMCPDGGWNSGNPLVYDVAGEPRVGPTVWALLALRQFPARIENRKSIEWLERVYPEIKGPGSLAVAHLCLSVYGRPADPLEPALDSLYASNQFLNSVLVAAWTIVALNGVPTWLTPAPVHPTKHELQEQQH